MYEVFGFITDIGGFNGTIVMLISFIMSSYTGSIFSYTIVSQMYKISKPRKKQPRVLEMIHSQEHRLGE